MKYNFIILLICFFLVNNCGFEPVNLQSNYNISEITTKGDVQINYKIKSKLLSTNRSVNKEIIKININTKKRKSIKEKNINNEITKYEIEITTEVNFKSITNNSEGVFSFTKRGDYNVLAKYTDTLNNEKLLIKSLINELVEEIQGTLTNNLNDT